MRVTVLSSLPPQKGITPYTMHLLEALDERRGVNVEALGFRSLYPGRTYPGGNPEAEATRTLPAIRVRRPLRWYDPFSWIIAGVTLRGEILHT